MGQIKIVYTLTAHIHYRISQCSCKNFTTLCATFPWLFHDFPGPVVSLTTVPSTGKTKYTKQCAHTFPGSRTMRSKLWTVTTGGSLAHVIRVS